MRKKAVSYISSLIAAYALSTQGCSSTQQPSAASLESSGKSKTTHITTPAGKHTSIAEDHTLLSTCTAGHLPEGLEPVKNAQSSRAIKITNPYDLGPLSSYILEKIQCEKQIATSQGKKLVVIISEQHNASSLITLESLIIAGQANIDTAEQGKPSFIVAEELPYNELNKRFPRRDHISQQKLLTASWPIAEDAPLAHMVKMDTVNQKKVSYTPIDAPRTYDQKRLNIPTNLEHKLTSYFPTLELPQNQQWHLGSQSGIYLRNAAMVYFTNQTLQSTQTNTAFIITGSHHTFGLDACQENIASDQKKGCFFPYDQSLTALFKNKGLHVLAITFAQSADKLEPQARQNNPIIIHNLDLEMQGIDNRFERDMFEAGYIKRHLEREQKYLRKLQENYTGQIPFPHVPKETYMVSDYRQALFLLSYETLYDYNSTGAEKTDKLINALHEGNLTKTIQEFRLD